MCSTSSGRFPIRSACRAALLVLAAPLLLGPIAAQRREGALGGEFGRILAAADARAFAPPLFREALRHAEPEVRRQAALAAGRIGDAAALDGLIEALADSSRAVRAAAAFGLGLLKDARAVPHLLAL